MEKLEQITQMLTDRLTLVKAHIAADLKMKDDCFNGQHNRGRAAAEQNEIEWLEKALEALK